MNIYNLKGKFATIYLTFMTVYLIIREVTPLQFLIQSTVVSTVVFLFGFAVIIFDLLTDANCLKGRAVDFFAAFIIICTISCIINYKYGITDNIKCMAAMVLEYFVFFSAGSQNARKKNLKIILNALIITAFVFIFISVLMYLFSIDYQILTSRTAGDQGFDTTYGRLWGVFADPNVISYISLVSFFASFYLMYNQKKLWSYILYGINALFQMIFIMLSLSRSALLIMIAIPIISSIYPFISFLKKDIKKALCSILVTVLLSCTLYGFYYGLNLSMPFVKSAILKNVSVDGRKAIVTAFDNFYLSGGVKILNIEDNHTPEGENELPTDVEEIVRKDNKDDYSNGRFARWNGGIQVFKTTPVFGTSPRNAVAIAKEKTPDTVMGKYGWVTHCSYLEIPVCSGILGTVALFGAFIFVAVSFIKSSLKRAFNHHTYIVFLSFITIAAGVFFVSDVFFVFTINSLLFFFLFGYIYGDSQDDKNGIIFNFFNIIKGKLKK